MAIYDNLPYTNFHELNADWLLKTVKDTSEYLDQVKAQLDEVELALEDFNAKYPELSDLSDVFTVSGNDVSIPGNFMATQFIGALLGNASTATTAANATNADHATTADSATNATNATNANYATTAGSLSGGQTSTAVVYFSQVATQDWYGVDANTNDLWLKKYEDSANKWHFQILIYRPDLVGYTQKWMSLININITDGTIGN